MALAADAEEMAPQEEAVKVKLSRAQAVVKSLFAKGKKGLLAENVWYESPDILTTSKDRVWTYWQLRPTRRIDKICDGKKNCGCTWTQLDGTRGASYFRLNTDGEVTFIREVPEVAAGTKAKENTVESLKPAFGIMGAINSALNIFPEYLRTEDPNAQKTLPRFGLAAPKTRRAEDVVSYLWEEAQFAEDVGTIVDKTVAEYSEDSVYEDLTVVDEAWPRGVEEIRAFQRVTKEGSPERLKFVLDEITDGTMSCTVCWHVEVFGQKSPRGVSFYELDDAGKVKYVRQAYNLTF